MSDKQKLINFLRDLNVTFVEIDQRTYYDRKQTALQHDRDPGSFRDAPFTGGLGITWNDKTIYALPDVEWPAILHEAGHLLTDTLPTGHPKNIGEDVFFGWEWRVIQKLGLDTKPFLHSNRAYGISWYDTTDGKYYSTVEELDTPERTERYFVSAIEYSKKHGRVAADNEPLVLR